MKRSLALLLALALSVGLLAGCQNQPAAPGSSGPSKPETTPADFSFVNAMEALDGQTGHRFWSGIYFRSLDLTLTLEGMTADAYELGQEPDFFLSSGEQTQPLADLLMTLPLVPDSRREEEARPVSGEASVFQFSYNTAEEPNNQAIHLLFSQDGRLYLTSDAGPDAPCVSYEVQGGAEAADALLTLVWEELGHIFYSAVIFTSPYDADPASPVVQVGCSNTASIPLTLGQLRLILDGKTVYTDDSATGQTVPGGEVFYLEFSPAEVPGIADGVTLRVELDVTGETAHGPDSATLSAEALFRAGGETLFSTPEPMTPQSQDYYNRYISAWAVVFPQDWDYGRRFADVPFYFAADGCFLEDARKDLASGETLDYRGSISDRFPDGYVPGVQLEELMAQYFGLSAQEVRNWAGSAYDAASGQYYLPGGYGGAYPYCQVEAARENGNRLELDCAWYSAVDNAPLERCTITLEFSEDGSFLYRSSRLL